MEKLNDYEFIIWNNITYTVEEFFAKYPDCNVKNVKHLKTQEIPSRNAIREIIHVKGCAFTSMGDLEVFNTI